MTYEEYVQATNHECNYLCQNRATHADIAFTDDPISCGDMIQGLKHYVGHVVRIDEVRLAPEAEDWAARSKHMNLYHYGRNTSPSESSRQIKWLVIFTLWDEIQQEA